MYIYIYTHCILDRLRLLWKCVCVCPGWACARFTVGQWGGGGGQRGPHLCCVSRPLLQPVQLSALRSHLLRAVSAHNRQEPTDKHTLPSLPQPHLTHQPPQRWASSRTQYWNIWHTVLFLSNTRVNWFVNRHKTTMLIILFQSKMPNTCCVQLLQCEDLLFFLCFISL